MERIMLNLTVLEVCAKKLLTDPFVLYLVMAAMHDNQRNIHTKFGSNWSRSVRGEEFCKIVDDDRQWQSQRTSTMGNDDNNWCKVIAIAHMVFGQVS